MPGAKDTNKEPENHLDEQEAKWFAVYTRYKREKLARKELGGKGVEVYVPIQKLTRVYVRKRKVVEMPLISCYIFVKITKKEYLTVLQNDQVVNFVKIAKNLISIPEREIGLLKQVTGEGIPVSAEPARMYQGDKVEIIAGKLTGLKGTLVEEHGNKEVLLDLETMGYTLRMTVDVNLLRKIK